MCNNTALNDLEITVHFSNWSYLTTIHFQNKFILHTIEVVQRLCSIPKQDSHVLYVKLKKTPSTFFLIQKKTNVTIDVRL